jgi:hypothetical protein
LRNTHLQWRSVHTINQVVNKSYFPASSDDQQKSTDIDGGRIEGSGARNALQSILEDAEAGSVEAYFDSALADSLSRRISFAEST